MRPKLCMWAAVEGLAQGQPAYAQLRVVSPFDGIPTVCGTGVSSMLSSREIY